jgi:TolB-like protein/Tfp pilus assembly protein PilF
MQFSRLLAELKRRHVYRAASVYAAVGFVILQAADVILPHVGVPEWALRLVVTLVILGFPVALVLAWALDLTPAGIRRTEPEAADAAGEPLPPALGARTVLVTGLLIVLGAGIGAGWFLKPGAAENTVEGDAVAQVDPNSIAVLPFTDMSAAGDQEWFADGLTEEVLNALSRLGDLRVTARNSSFQFKGQAVDVRQVALQLGVATVLEGSVRRDGDRLRVSAQLARASDGFQLWSDTYDSRVDHVFTVQQNIAENIARVLGAYLGGNGDIRRATTDLEAYDLYLRARHGWQLPNRDRLQQSALLYQRAIDRDSAFAAAYAGQAQTYVNLAVYGYMPANEALPRARAASERALQLDGNLDEAHTTRGYVLMSALEFDAAAASLQRALELNPSSAWGHHYYSLLLMMQGRLADAVHHNQQALALDPLSLPANANRGIIQTQLGSRAAAIGALERARSMAPDFPLASYYLGVNHAAQGSWDAALALLQSAHAQAPDYPGVPAALAFVNRNLGRSEESQAIVAALEQRRRQGDARARTNHAFALAVLGDRDAAFAALDSVQWDVPVLIGLRADPLLAGLRSDTRYPALLTRLGADR